jgi:ABC-type multidrug transport system ATPase subunit
MRGRTVIAIAHRLATLRDFDRVVMLKAGKIIEDGSPDRLMQGLGPYRELVTQEMSRPCNTRGLNYRLSARRVWELSGSLCRRPNSRLDCAVWALLTSRRRR